MKNKPNVILGLTGSVAAITAPKLAEAIRGEQYNLRVVATQPALYFLPDKSLVSDKIYVDADEWNNKHYARGDDVMHIEFRKWADVMLIAPLSANTLAKIAYGICDNFLTCIARAWDKQKPLLIAPAMNTEMWVDPITREHLSLIEQRYNLTVIDPVEKKLACGDTGVGAMASIDAIMAELKNAIE